MRNARWIAMSFVLVSWVMTAEVQASAPKTGSEGAACYPNATCNAPLECKKSTCVDSRPPEGKLGGACYGNRTCDSRLECIANSCRRIHPGTLGGACFGNGSCFAPLTCQKGVCDVVAGTHGAKCGPRQSCGYGLECSKGACIHKPTGSADGPCYANLTCNRGLTCVTGWRRCLPKPMLAAFESVFSESYVGEVRTSTESKGTGCARFDDYDGVLRKTAHPCVLDVETRREDACQEQKHAYRGQLSMAKARFDVVKLPGGAAALRASAPGKWVEHRFSSGYRGKETASTASAINVAFGKDTKALTKLRNRLKKIAAKCASHPLPDQLPTTPMCETARHCYRSVVTKQPWKRPELNSLFFKARGHDRCAGFLASQRNQTNAPAACRLP